MLSSEEDGFTCSAHYSTKPVFTDLTQGRRTPIVGIDMISARKLISEALEKFKGVDGSNHHGDDSKVLANPRGIIKSYLNQAEANDPIKFSAYKKLCFAHIEEYHNQQSSTEFTCLVCNSIFSNWNSLQRHLQFHVDFKPFTCDICTRTFYSQCKLKRHMVIHDTIKRYKCPICDRRLGRTEHLKRHLLVHTDNKSFGCSGCAHTTKRLDGIRRHIKRKHASEGAEVIMLTTNTQLIGKSDNDNREKIIKFQEDLDNIMEPLSKKKKLAFDDKYIDGLSDKNCTNFAKNIDSVDGNAVTGVKDNDNIQSKLLCSILDPDASDGFVNESNRHQNKISNISNIQHQKIIKLQHMPRNDNISAMPHHCKNQFSNGKLADSSSYNAATNNETPIEKNYAISNYKSSSPSSSNMQAKCHMSNISTKQLQQPSINHAYLHNNTSSINNQYTQQQLHEQAIANLKNMPPTMVIGHQYLHNHYHHHGFHPLAMFGVAPTGSFSS